METVTVMNPPFLPSLYSPHYYFSVPVVYVILVLYAAKNWMKNKPVDVGMIFPLTFLTLKNSSI